MRRKIIGSMLAGAIVFIVGSMTLASNIDTTHCNLEIFKVTAYYSPIPGQDFYYRGNYSDEVILNGRGIQGASGEPVFDGMLAAPSSYAFGTKVYFPGRGIGQIEDRGGAIVNKGERSDATETRIDIWAGRGEEGLKRALSFGVQYLDAWVCPAWAISDSEVGIDYDAFPQYDDFFHASLRVMSLRPDREDPWVEALQNYLIALGYMGKGRNTGYYGRETKAAVCKYQQDYIGLAASRDGCGYFGPWTRNDMKLRLKTMGLSNLYGPEGAIIHNSFSANETPPIQDILLTSSGEVEVLEPDTLDERIINHLFSTGEFKQYQFITPLKKGDEGKVVRILQRKLQWLGYLPTDMVVTGVYDLATIQAVHTFQVEKGLVTGHEDPNIWGFFGPKTREVINDL